MQLDEQSTTGRLIEQDPSTEGIDVSARLRVTAEEVTGHADALELPTGSSRDRAQDDRECDRYSQPAVEYRVEEGVVGVVVADGVPLEAELAEDTIEDRVQRRTTPVGEAIELPKSFFDIDMLVEVGSDHQSGLIESDRPLVAAHEDRETFRLRHPREGIGVSSRNNGPLPPAVYGSAVARDPHPFLLHEGPIPFAHRGGAGDWPENSMEAFANAVDLGYQYVETDAHVTADGVVIAFHDDHLDRVTDREGLISDLPWSEVSQARIDGRAPIPLLEDLLATWPELRINIDPKHDEVVEPLAALLTRTRALDRVCLGSFSDRRLDEFRTRFGSDVCTSMGPKGVARLRAASFGIGRRTPAGDCLQVPTHAGKVPLVDSRFVRRAHRMDLPVHVWTIDDPDEMHRLLDLGVDGIMTDRPAVLRSVLEARGSWP